MSNLRIIELEQQLKRRDERLNEIEAKVKDLPQYSLYIDDETSDAYMVNRFSGDYIDTDSVLECFK